MKTVAWVGIPLSWLAWVWGRIGDAMLVRDLLQERTLVHEIGAVITSQWFGPVVFIACSGLLVALKLGWLSERRGNGRDGSFTNSFNTSLTLFSKTIHEHHEWRLDERGLSVHPDRLTLWSQGWSQKVSAVLTNHGKRPRFSVFVRIWSDDSGLSSKDILIDVDEGQSGRPTVMAGPVEVSLDAIVLDLIDDNGHSFVFVRFYELDPSERRRIKVSLRKGIERECSVSLKVAGAKNEPDALMERSRQGAFGLMMPESARIVAARTKLSNPSSESGSLRLRIWDPGKAGGSLPPTSRRSKK